MSTYGEKNLIAINKSNNGFLADEANITTIFISLSQTAGLPSVCPIFSLPNLNLWASVILLPLYLLISHI